MGAFGIRRRNCRSSHCVSLSVFRSNESGGNEALVSGQHTAVALIWVAIGIFAAFYAWSYVQSYLPAQTAA